MNTTNQAELFQPGCVLKICAPMVRYSKLAFRMLVRKYDCDLCFTPMIIAADFVRSVKARDSEFTTSKDYGDTSRWLLCAHAHFGIAGCSENSNNCPLNWQIEESVALDVQLSQLKATLSADLRDVAMLSLRSSQSLADRPLIVQFAAKDPLILANAATMVAPFANGIDLNCGCPQRWAVSDGYGACLINKPELVRDMVRQVRNQVCIPKFSTSIKIRIHRDIRATVDLCRKAESAGVSWITVHGRTTEERHQPVHYDAIKTVKESVSIPVVANGDIRSLRDVEDIHLLTGVDGVMAARGLLANPAMFAGSEDTPLECVWDWVDVAMKHGTPFTCFHHHLMYMMEKITSQQEKKVFNSLSSTAGVIDYLLENYSVCR